MSDWTKFTKRIPVNASKEAIYKAWAMQTGIESWFLRSSIFTAGEKLRGENELIKKFDCRKIYASRDARVSRPCKGGFVVPKTDQKVDKYIEKSQDFAKPILLHIRALVHEVCPEASETTKWGMPFFEYKGLVCNMASFKQHCSFGFWKGTLMKDDAKLFSTGDRDGMGHLGKITSLADLPSDDILRAYIAEAIDLNERNVKLPPKPKPASKELVVPKELLEELAKNDTAAATFDAFPYSCKKEYAEWIADAKTDVTRMKRIATTIEWLAEGKRRNWKYENC